MTQCPLVSSCCRSGGWSWKSASGLYSMHDSGAKHTRQFSCGWFPKKKLLIDDRRAANSQSITTSTTTITTATTTTTTTTTTTLLLLLLLLLLMHADELRYRNRYSDLATERTTEESWLDPGPRQEIVLFWKASSPPLGPGYKRLFPRR